MVGYGSAVINSQLVPVLTARAVSPPNASSPMYTGRGATPPTVPQGVGGNSSSANSQATAEAAASPFDWKRSPVPWLLVMLFAGVLGLRYIHWEH